eukprot:TRINITY_DN136_c0_g2_i8.p1 TRINITY_DN136_c0_g2~~TRINITY_DN136_c0_g2_i8.p1  ORF type:complete len:572 (-),score=69.17 TRINITY_DN136_c0_g2_i8:915-2630(-)
MQNTHLRVANSNMIIPTVLSLLILSALAEMVEDFHSLNCSSYDPDKMLQQAAQRGNCLSALRDPSYGKQFEKCKQYICFLFIHEPPFVIYNQQFFHAGENVKAMQVPFLCKNPKERHRSLGGSAFDIIQATSANDEYCAWVGPLHSCTWNALVDFVAVMGDKEGYRFAVVGPMLETPSRKCSHFASSSWWDGKMVVLGRNVRENIASGHPVWQLISPFQRETWIVVGSVVALFLIVCLIIGYRFHVFRGKPLIKTATAYFVFMGEITSALAVGRMPSRLSKEDVARKTVHTEKVGFDGQETECSSQRSSAADVSLQIDENKAETEDTIRNGAFLTKFSLATSLFRVSLIAFVAMFSLFYEVAVVNFLFQQQNLQITKDIEHFTSAELSKYSVVQDTAMEAIWNFRVNRGGTKFDDEDKSDIPWNRCRNGTECFSWVLDDNNPVQFYVTYELEAVHLIEAEADCELVTIFETKDSIHQFNSGWLFNEQVPIERRRELDREIAGLKIKGRLSALLGGMPELCAPNITSSITFTIILLPVALLVLPPLLFSAMVALCWRKNNAKKKNVSPVRLE